MDKTRLHQRTYEIILPIVQKCLDGLIKVGQEDNQISIACDLKSLANRVYSGLSDNPVFDVGSKEDQELYAKFNSNPWNAAHTNPWLIEVALVTALNEKHVLYTLKNGRFPKNLLDRLRDYSDEIRQIAKMRHCQEGVSYTEIDKVIEKPLNELTTWLIDAQKNGYTNLDACLKLAQLVKTVQEAKGKWTLKFDATPELEFFANDFEDEKLIVFTY